MIHIRSLKYETHPPAKRGESYPRHAYQDVKGARWMPWHRKPTKDVASCDKLRPAANRPNRRSPNGGTRLGQCPGVALPNQIGFASATGGTETSKYPEERKSTETPRVAASESGSAQTRMRGEAWGRCHAGVVGAVIGEPQRPGAVAKEFGSGTGWKARPQRVRAPYAKPSSPRTDFPSRAGHVKPGSKLGGPPSKAKHSPVTDSGPVP